MRCKMPVISMFYGIIVQLYFFDTDRHNLPHIHIRYSEFTASIAIETGELLAGDFSGAAVKISESVD